MKRVKSILPFALVPQTELSDGKGQNFNSPINTRQNFLEGMCMKENFEAAAIPVDAPFPAQAGWAGWWSGTIPFAKFIEQPTLLRILALKKK